MKTKRPPHSGSAPSHRQSFAEQLSALVVPAKPVLPQTPEPVPPFALPTWALSIDQAQLEDLMGPLEPGDEIEMWWTERYAAGADGDATWGVRSEPAEPYFTIRGERETWGQREVYAAGCCRVERVRERVRERVPWSSGSVLARREWAQHWPPEGERRTLPVFKASETQG